MESKSLLSILYITFSFNNIYPIDFKKSFGGKKNNCGLIAEEVLEVIPEAVTVPEGYDEANFDESKGLKNDLLEVDYTKLVPHLIKLCQVQQEEIDDLKNRIALLEKK